MAVHVGRRGDETRTCVLVVPPPPPSAPHPQLLACGQEVGIWFLGVRGEAGVLYGDTLPARPPLAAPARSLGGTSARTVGRTDRPTHLPIDRGVGAGVLASEESDQPLRGSVVVVESARRSVPRRPSCASAWVRAIASEGWVGGAAAAALLALLGASQSRGVSGRTHFCNACCMLEGRRAVQSLHDSWNSVCPLSSRARTRCSWRAPAAPASPAQADRRRRLRRRPCVPRSC